jgi:hypothetical protein
VAAVLQEQRSDFDFSVHEVLTPGLIADVFGVTVSVVRHPMSGAPQFLYQTTQLAGQTRDGAPLSNLSPS